MPLPTSAGRDNILQQFLIESVVLAGSGGLAGIGVGAAAALVLGRANRWPVLVSPGAVLLALTFSAGVGIFFGFYPAWRASRLNPIECLRHE